MRTLFWFLLVAICTMLSGCRCSSKKLGYYYHNVEVVWNEGEEVCNYVPLKECKEVQGTLQNSLAWYFERGMTCQEFKNAGPQGSMRCAGNTFTRNGKRYESEFIIFGDKKECDWKLQGWNQIVKPCPKDIWDIPDVVAPTK